MKTYDIINAGPRNRFLANGRIVSNSGRLVQMQNLPQNHLADLELARELVREGDLDTVEMAFGNVPDTLSQLIRTAFVAPKGKVFGVFDFSAIEARVIAWCANEQWRLDVFNTHGKIYEASASKMFNVPLESVTKGSDLRQKGKVSELALGYQGGTGALINMGALKMGLQEEELQGLVDAWREANPGITKFWKNCEMAAMSAVQGQPIISFPHVPLKFYRKNEYLFIELPSGRAIAYYKPIVKENRFGKGNVAYHGTDSITKKWTVIDSYGGKWVENCLAADTKVLTLRGLINIVDVKNNDYLWDGIGWVSHQGLVHKGQKETISLNGVRLTPDHKILTNAGWKEASSLQGFEWKKVQLPNGAGVPRLKRKKINLVGAMCLRKNNKTVIVRHRQRKAEILRVFNQGNNAAYNTNAWNVKAPSVLGMEINAGQMQAPNTPSVAQLRGTGNIRVRKVEQIPALLGRYGGYIPQRSYFGEKGRKWKLRSRKLHLGNDERANTEQAIQYQNKYPVGAYNSGRSIGKKRHKNKHNFLQNKSRSAGASFTIEAGRYEPVYDLVNAGPRHRFTVMSDNGPMIVHNCVQAIARDCLAETLLAVNEQGYRIVAHVHDEIIVELDCETAEKDFEIIKNIMSTEVKWGKGLPLTADGYLTKFYKKD